MVHINLDHDKYQFTTKTVLDRFNIDEKVIPTKNVELEFYFREGEPYLLAADKEYIFESRGSLVFFLQKLSLNSALITSLSNETLTAVVNESLQQLTIFNLVIDKNTDQILTVTAFLADLVSWRKILQTIHEFFLPLEEKILYLTTFGGLGISIKMNDDDSSDLDILSIQPQKPSSISIYRGIAREEIPLRGYDESEIMETLKEKLQIMADVDPSISKNYSLVRD